VGDQALSRGLLDGVQMGADSSWLEL